MKNAKRKSYNTWSATTKTSTAKRLRASILRLTYVRRFSVLERTSCQSINLSLN
jgi:hypothetical protein